MTVKPIACVPLLAALYGCATAPPAPPPGITFEEKLSWMLRLEDRRILREPAGLPVPPVSVGAQGVSPPSVPDLLRLVRDDEARVRRRAALAIGRVGLAEGATALVPVLREDPDAEVRQIAAFAMGLIASPASVAPLTAALQDAAPIVQGRAAEALGLIGPPAAGTAGAIATMARAHVDGGAFDGLAPDELTYPLAPATDAVRLAVQALARLKAYEPLAQIVLDAAGQPRTRWWPVAAALRRVEDKRAAPALLALLDGQGQYTRGFAARGLGAIGAAEGVERLLAVAKDAERDPFVGVEAIRALGQLKERRAVPVLLAAAVSRVLAAGVRAEAVAALGACGSGDDGEALLDLLSDRSPPVRAAAFTALAAIDRERFLTAMSSLDSDRDWTVRAAIARVLGTFDADQGVPLLEPFLADADQRVIAAAIGAAAAMRAPHAERVLTERLGADDPGVRVAAATGLGELRATGAAAALRAAYDAGQRDDGYDARAAALGALAKLGRDAALPALEAALVDKSWAVRVRAAALLDQLAPGRDTASAIRPAPTHLDPNVYSSPAVVSPSFTAHAYLDTDKGTVQIELAMLDAPLTVHNFVTLARKGFFDGLAFHRVVPAFVVQDGDPRGDGEGGPGYAIRDERSERPYLRGTVGMALDWADTGGSQYFVTHGPQPHLDARYPVFGQVIVGMDVIDRLAVGDVVRRVRVWNGTSW